MSAAGLDPEDQARADFYGLIARLFYQPPDAALLAELRGSAAFGDTDSALARAWREMITASGAASVEELEREHTELFVGTGKAEVTPYLSHYVLAHANDNPLVELRAQLDRWGVARQARANEPEDHVAGICEAMRFAIAVQQRSLQDQEGYFNRFVYRGTVAFCEAINASPKARFYRSVAGFAHRFVELEREAFAIG